MAVRLYANHAGIMAGVNGAKGTGNINIEKFPKKRLT
jgi:hypothetical protein